MALHSHACSGGILSSQPNQPSWPAVAASASASGSYQQNVNGQLDAYKAAHADAWQSNGGLANGFISSTRGEQRQQCNAQAPQHAWQGTGRSTSAHQLDANFSNAAQHAQQGNAAPARPSAFASHSGQSMQPPPQPCWRPLSSAQLHARQASSQNQPSQDKRYRPASARQTNIGPMLQKAHAQAASQSQRASLNQPAPTFQPAALAIPAWDPHLASAAAHGQCNAGAEDLIDLTACDAAAPGRPQMCLLQGCHLADCLQVSTMLPDPHRCRTFFHQGQ